MNGLVLCFLLWLYDFVVYGIVFLILMVKFFEGLMNYYVMVIKEKFFFKIIYDIFVVVIIIWNDNFGFDG